MTRSSTITDKMIKLCHVSMTPCVKHLKQTNTLTYSKYYTCSIFDAQSRLYFIDEYLYITKRNGSSEIAKFATLLIDLTWVVV